MSTSDIATDYIVDVFLAVEADTYDLLTDRKLAGLGSPAALHLALGAYCAHFRATKVGLCRGTDPGAAAAFRELCPACPGLCALSELEAACLAVRCGVDLTGLPAASRDAYLAGARKRAEPLISAAAAAAAKQLADGCRLGAARPAPVSPRGGKSGPPGRGPLKPVERRPPPLPSPPATPDK